MFYFRNSSLTVVHLLDHSFEEPDCGSESRFVRWSPTPSPDPKGDGWVVGMSTSKLAELEPRPRALSPTVLLSLVVVFARLQDVHVSDNCGNTRGPLPGWWVQ